MSLDEDRPHCGRSGFGPDRPATSQWAAFSRQGVALSARGFVRDGNQGTGPHHEMVSGKAGLFRWIVDFRVDRDYVRHARGFSFEHSGYGLEIAWRPRVRRAIAMGLSHRLQG